MDGDAAKKKWVLTAASSEYMIGTFDGTKFTPETGKLTGHRGRGFYAAQTFSDIPDGRRIQIGWFQAPTPGMPFNQSMSLPMALSLRSTAEGPRLTWQPVKELESLRMSSIRIGPLSLREGGPNPFANRGGDLIELRADFEPGDADEVTFIVRGVRILYDRKKQELLVNGHGVPAPLESGHQSLIVYADRTAFEVFANDGLVYVPMPVIPNPRDTSVRVASKGGTVQFSRLDLHVLRSAWSR